MSAQVILNLHGIGSPEHGVTEDERSYWISHQAFISLLQTIVVLARGPIYLLRSRLTTETKATL